MSEDIVVKVIEHWGSDQAIIESARMSTAKGFLGWGTPEAPGDEKLLAYLYKNKHMSPFEFGGMVVEVTCPIFVAREWQRHRTFSYNEHSSRYEPLPNEHEVPTIERMIGGSGSTTNKQAANNTGSLLSRSDAEYWRSELLSLMDYSEEVYQRGLALGVPKEVARYAQLVNRMTKMRVTANLRNWLQFLTLRLDKSAQLEIRLYAQEVSKCLEILFPKTMTLFNQDRNQ